MIKKIIKYISITIVLILTIIVVGAIFVILKNSPTNVDKDKLKNISVGEYNNGDNLFPPNAKELSKLDDIKPSQNSIIITAQNDKNINNEQKWQNIISKIKTSTKIETMLPPSPAENLDNYGDIKITNQADFYEIIISCKPNNNNCNPLRISANSINKEDIENTKNYYDTFHNNEIIDILKFEGIGTDNGEEKLININSTKYIYSEFCDVGCQAIIKTLKNNVEYIFEGTKPRLWIEKLIINNK